MLSRHNRITEKSRVEWLMKKGARFETPLFTFKFARRKQDPSRFALVVSGKRVKTAVGRNQLRRKMAEAVRRHLLLLKSPVDAAIIAKSGALQAKHTELEAGLKEAFNRLNRYVQ